ncbi:MAG: hypothetical protein SCK28_11570 [Bacillota bacterium]|nr:hypothetical protein [Bacillota bacterium]
MTALSIVINIVQAALLSTSMILMVGEKIRKNEIVAFAIIYGLAVPLARSIYGVMHAPFYTHTMILITIAILLYKFLIKLSWLKAAAATLLGVTIMFITDALIVVQVIKLFDLTVQEITNNMVLYTLLTSITSLVMLLIIVLNRITGISLFNPQD